jgi:hypothetical protein
MTGKVLQHKLLGDVRKAYIPGWLTDIFYVPAAARTDFAVGCTAMTSTGLHHELAIPNVLAMIANTTDDVETFKVHYHYAANEDVYKQASQLLLPEGE